MPAPPLCEPGRHGHTEGNGKPPNILTTSKARGGSQRRGGEGEEWNPQHARGCQNRRPPAIGCGRSQRATTGCVAHHHTKGVVPTARAAVNNKNVRRRGATRPAEIRVRNRIGTPAPLRPVHTDGDVQGGEATALRGAAGREGEAQQEAASAWQRLGVNTPVPSGGSPCMDRPLCRPLGRFGHSTFGGAKSGMDH